MSTRQPKTQPPAAPTDKARQGATRPAAASKPAGQPALKGPLDKPRTA